MNQTQGQNSWEYYQDNNSKVNRNWDFLFFKLQNHNHQKGTYNSYMQLQEKKKNTAISYFYIMSICNTLSNTKYPSVNELW